MSFSVTDEALAKLDALDDAGKRSVLERLSGEERAQVVSALPAWRSKRTEAEPKAQPKVRANMLESLASGAGQAALGFGDEAGAAMQTQWSVPGAIRDVLTGKRGVSEAAGDLRDTYRQARSENRSIDDAARTQHPGAYYTGLGAGIIGTAPAMPALGVAKGAGTAARLLANVGTGALQGGAFGAGSSTADLTEGQFGQFGKDVGISGAFGGLTSGVLGAAGEGVRAIRGRAARGVKEAVEAEQAVQEALAAKNIKSAVGSARSATQNASRVLENAERAAKGSDPELAAKAYAWLQSPEARSLYREVTENSLESGPQRLQEMAEAKHQLAQLVGGKAESVAAATGEALRDPVAKHVIPRAATIGHRILPLVATPVMAGIGGLVGGTEGMVAGGALGTLAGGIMSLTQGAPGRIIKNLVDKPAVRKAFWERVLATSGASAENVAAINALEKAARTSPEAFTALFHEVTGGQRNEGAEAPPDRAKALRKALEE